MRAIIRTTALAAWVLSPAAFAAPFGMSSSETSVAPEASTYLYTPSISASAISEIESFSVSFGSGSWSNFPTATSSADFGQGPVSSSDSTPYGSLGGSGDAATSHTVVVASFTVTVPLPVTTSGSASSHPTLSTITATATVPLESGSTTVVHTFTVTETAITSEPLVTPLPSASLSLGSSVLSKLSRSAKSASSLGSALRSIFSDINGFQSGVGPVVAPNPAVSTKPGAEKMAVSEITASFTLTVPTSTFFVPIMPTHTGPMSTADFTITLPAPPTSTESTKTSTIQSSGEVTVTESCSTSTSSTSSCSETPAPTGFPETLTYTLSTKVTLTIDEPETLSSPVPSGSDAITLTYTLPGGPELPSKRDSDKQCEEWPCREEDNTDVSEQPSNSDKQCEEWPCKLEDELTAKRADAKRADNKQCEEWPCREEDELPTKRADNKQCEEWPCREEDTNVGEFPSKRDDDLSCTQLPCKFNEELVCEEWPCKFAEQLSCTSLPCKLNEQFACEELPCKYLVPTAFTPFENLQCEEWPCKLARGDGSSGEHELPYWRRKVALA